jgi:hypothetical protein
MISCYLDESGRLSRYGGGLRTRWPGRDSRQRQEIFVYTKASRPGLGPIQTPIQWVPGALSSWVKRPGRETDHSPPSSAEVRNGGAIPPIPHILSWHRAQLINHRNNFYIFCLLLFVIQWLTDWLEGTYMKSEQDNKPIIFKNTVAYTMQWLRVGEYTTTVSGQRLGKHVPAETNTHVIIGHPLPGGYKYGDLALQVGESRIWDSKMWSWAPRDSDPRMTALARPSSNCKRQTDPLVREDVA